MIDQLQESAEPIQFTLQSKQERETQAERFRLKAAQRKAESEKASAEALTEQLLAQVAILENEKKVLVKSEKKLKEELSSTKRDLHSTQQRKVEVEHNLRTSQFRESEAVVYLRQFRRFYYRLLHKAQTESSGRTENIIAQIPGAPDLKGLVDIDRLMVQSGLLEESEVGSDANAKDPSRSSLQRSTQAADAMNQKVGDAAVGDNDKAVVLGARPVAATIAKSSENAETIEARQRLYSTPAGQLVEMREKSLEKELLEMSEKCSVLKRDLASERANVEALTSSTGAAAAFEKLKQAQELKLLKEQLEKKDNDLKTVVWKMNELHVVGKTMQEKVENREHHVVYLEQSLSASQEKCQSLVQEKNESIVKHSDELANLRAVIDSNASPLWQLNSDGHACPPLSRRLVVHFSEKVPDGPASDGRRKSIGELEEWLTSYEQIPASAAQVEVATQTDDGGDLAGEHARLAEQYLAEQSALIRNEKQFTVDELLFMDEESSGDKRLPSEARSSYDGLVDAYKNNTDLVAGDGSSFNLDGSAHSDSTETRDNRSRSSGLDYDHENHMPEKRAAPNQTSNTRLTLGSFMDRFRAQKKAQQVDDDEESATPEFLKKFRTIGKANLKEEVIETSGSAAAQEALRTSFGEKLRVLKSSEDVLSVATSSNHAPPRRSSIATGSVADTSSVQVPESRRSSIGYMPSTVYGNSTTDVKSPASSQRHLEVSSSPTASSQQATLSPATKMRSYVPSSPVRSHAHAPQDTIASPSRWSSKASVETGSTPTGSGTTSGYAPSVEASVKPSEAKSMFANAAPIAPKLPAYSAYSASSAAWTPRKREDSDSDDDSFVRNFVKGARSGVGVPSQSVSIPDSDDNTAEKSLDESSPSICHHDASNDLTDGESTATREKTDTGSDASNEKAVQFRKRDSVIGIADFIDDSSWPTLEPGTGYDDSLSTLESKESPSKKVDTVESVAEAKSEEDTDLGEEATSAASLESRSRPAPTKKKSFLDDSDSEDESTVASARPKVTETTVSPPSATKNDDSESSTEADQTPAPEPVPTPAQAPSLSLPKKKKSFLDDSDSEDESTVASVKPKTSVAKPVLAAPESSSMDVKNVDPAPKEAPTLESDPAPTPTRVLSLPKKKKSFLDDSDSEDESTVASFKPKTSVAKPVLTPPVKKALLDESESSDADESPISEVTKAEPETHPMPEPDPESDPSTSSEPEPAPASALSLPKKKKKSFLDDSESEDESTVASRTKVESANENDTGMSSLLRVSEPESEGFDDAGFGFGAFPETPSEPARANDHDAAHTDAIASEDAFHQRSSDEGSSVEEAASAENESQSESSYEEEEVIEESESTAEEVVEEEAVEKDPFQMPVENGFGDFQAFGQPKSTDDEDDPFAAQVDFSTHTRTVHKAAASDGFGAPANVSNTQKELEMFLGGKPADFAPRRSVDDFGAAVTPAVTAPTKKGRPSTKFVIKNGKLVKDEGTVESADSGSAAPSATSNPQAKFVIKNGKLVKNESFTDIPADSLRSTDHSKTKFVIKDGKLVKDDSSIPTNSGSLSGMLQSQTEPKMERRNSLDSKLGDAEEDERSKRGMMMTFNSKTRRKASGLASGNMPKSNYVIRDGKLVRVGDSQASTPAPSKEAPSSSGAPAFTIVDGKLVKAAPDKKKKDKKKEKKSGKDKDSSKKSKKKEKKKKERVRKDSF